MHLEFAIGVGVVREGVRVVWCGRRCCYILDCCFEYFALQQEFIFDFEHVLFSFIFVTTYFHICCHS